MAHSGSSNVGKRGALAASSSRAAACGDVLLVFLVLLIAGGDRAPSVNEAHYITRLKHYWDSDWIQGDLFLDSPDAHLTVVLVFGWTTLWLPLAAVAWLGRVLSWALIAWAWRRLSWRVAPLPGVAALTAALWCVGVREASFAGEWVVGGFEAKSIAYGLVLAALGSWVRDEGNRVGWFLGLATAFHVLVGGWSTLLLGGLWLVERRSWRSLRLMAPGLVGGGVIGLAGVLPPLLMNAGAPPDAAAEAARVYVFERLPHHLAPLSKGWPSLLDHGARHLVVLGLLVVATVLARRAPNEPLRRLCRYAWGAAGLALAGLAIESLLHDSPERAAGLLRYYWFRTNDIAAPMAAALGLGAWLSLALKGRRAVAPLGLAAAVGVAAWFLVPASLDRLRGGPPPADKSAYNYPAWVDVCRWAREQTEADALFLTPRRARTFHWRAERAEVVVYKNVPQDAAGLLEWRRRMETLHRRPGVKAGAKFGWMISPGQIGASRLRRLAGEYGFDYVLTDRRRPASLPVAYQNEGYLVYDLHSAELRSEPAAPTLDAPAAAGG